MPFERDCDENPVYTFGRGDLVICLGTDADGDTRELVVHTTPTPRAVGEAAPERAGETSTHLPDCLRLRFETAASLTVFVAQAVALLEAMGGTTPRGP
jgi:hypothetical protein